MHESVLFSFLERFLFHMILGSNGCGFASHAMPESSVPHTLFDSGVVIISPDKIKVMTIFPAAKSEIFHIPGLLHWKHHMHVMHESGTDIKYCCNKLFYGW